MGKKKTGLDALREWTPVALPGPGDFSTRRLTDEDREALRAAGRDDLAKEKTWRGVAKAAYEGVKIAAKLAKAAGAV